MPTVIGTATLPNARDSRLASAGNSRRNGRTAHIAPVASPARSQAPRRSCPGAAWRWNHTANSAALASEDKLLDSASPAVPRFVHSSNSRFSTALTTTRMAASFAGAAASPTA